ncbi:hypothetical protein [Qipengyuania seohaensis]|uniref:hypothetical protein n=1 Tax=Qipengyuania seohaensis TaxID=266951 RepID=UPI0018E22C29|nr:hypothetical protein [Qipengyuania seohaensis]
MININRLHRTQDTLQEFGLFPEITVEDGKSMKSDPPMNATGKNLCDTPLFSLTDCLNLDKTVRGSRSPKIAPALKLRQLKEMQLSLGAIDSLYEAGMRSKPIHTSLERKSHLRDVRDKSIALLQCFDMTPTTKFEQMNLALFTDKHIFSGIDLDGFQFVRSLQILCDVCERMDRKEPGNPQSGRKADERFHLLIGRLGLEYAIFWGGGNTPTSINDAGEGGPSIRFMHAAAVKITGAKMTHKKVFDAHKAAQTTVVHPLGDWKEQRHTAMKPQAR